MSWNREMHQPAWEGATRPALSRLRHLSSAIRLFPPCFVAHRVENLSESPKSPLFVHGRLPTLCKAPARPNGLVSFGDGRPFMYVTATIFKFDPAGSHGQRPSHNHKFIILQFRLAISSSVYAPVRSCTLPGPFWFLGAGYSRLPPFFLDRKLSRQSSFPRELRDPYVRHLLIWRRRVKSLAALNTRLTS